MHRRNFAYNSEGGGSKIYSSSVPLLTGNSDCSVLRQVKRRLFHLFLPLPQTNDCLENNFYILYLSLFNSVAPPPKNKLGRKNIVREFTPFGPPKLRLCLHIES
jgi:hypothetical protein